MKPYFIILFFALASLSACVKAPSYPIEPHIEFKSVSAPTAHILYYSPDSIFYIKDTIIISFTDGDGDIGPTPNGIDSCNFCGLRSGDSSCYNLRNFNVYMVDSRDSCIVTNQSADVEPFDTNYKAISGEILVITAINIKNPLCFTVTPSCPKDSLHYCVFIKDMAGHKSKKVKTSTIVVAGVRMAAPQRKKRPTGGISLIV